MDRRGVADVRIGARHPPRRRAPGGSSSTPPLSPLEPAELLADSEGHTADDALRELEAITQSEDDFVKHLGSLEIEGRLKPKLRVFVRLLPTRVHPRRQWALSHDALSRAGKWCWYIRVILHHPLAPLASSQSARPSPAASTARRTVQEMLPARREKALRTSWLIG